MKRGAVDSFRIGKQQQTTSSMGNGFKFKSRQHCVTLMVFCFFAPNGSETAARSIYTRMLRMLMRMLRMHGTNASWLKSQNETSEKTQEKAGETS